MIEAPSDQLALIAEAGGDSITFHLETVSDPLAVIANAREQGLGVGVALNPETPVEPRPLPPRGRLRALHERASRVLGSGVPTGIDRSSGACASSCRRGCSLQVDGGVGAENVRAVHDAGADLIVAASAIFYADDIAAA